MTTSAYPEVQGLCRARGAGLPRRGRNRRQGLRVDRRGEPRRRAADRLSRILRARFPGLGRGAGADQEPRLLQTPGGKFDRGAGTGGGRGFAPPRASNAIVVSIGISERSPVSVGCLWNTNLLIDADGTLLNHHRKLVPTFYEKLIWANGDGAGLRVSNTDDRQDRHADLRREHQSARALLADRARRTGAHFILSAGLADTAGERTGPL